ncbi:hypothetical protein ACHHYP_16737 [Achlya hypogyna]|uniref:Uncharacterized protein n=1 Tax=Achlya hypogyna TaxID=1202772 RepID=A0A1V9Y5Z4_ACHHY|nr:hypothetical protein ACHHYP_16737 [Achlya hypogyna]
MLPVAVADLSLCIASAVLGVSVLLTLALLQQGQPCTVFRDGLTFCSPAAQLAAVQSEQATDAAEREVFELTSLPDVPLATADAVGAHLVLASPLPVLTLLLATVAVAGAVYVASSDLPP